MIYDVCIAEKGLLIALIRAKQEQHDDKGKAQAAGRNIAEQLHKERHHTLIFLYHLA